MENGKSTRIPDASVIVVNYNGSSRVLRCVESVLQAGGGRIECLVVDNGSTDLSVPELERAFGSDDRLKIIRLERNFGPAYARNRGVEQAQAEYLAFLDNDAVATEGWLEQPLRRMTEDKSIGACQCKLMWMNYESRIDNVGAYLGSFGFITERNEPIEKDHGQWDSEAEIFSAKSAGMLARKQAVLDAGGFDEDYFIYMEETDLAWRMWLAGYRVIFTPRSVIRHEWATSESVLGRRKQTRLLRFHGSKNYILTLTKNLGTVRLLVHLPIHIVLWVGFAGFELCRGRLTSFCGILSGLLWCIAHFPGSLAKRRAVQRMRKVSDRELWPRIYRHTGLGRYLRRIVHGKREYWLERGERRGHDN